MLQSPLPDINSQCLSRQFVLDLPNIEITSLDITTHGCYILAGCSNGMVVLFDMTSNDENGTLVGHIRAKGMHTNLLVTVKFSPDNRFGFAGVMKGSMEMVAVDVGQIPVWHESALVGGKQGPKIIGRKGKGAFTVDQLGLRSMSKAAPLVCTYSHLDPKLRGFGAVTRLRIEEEKYLLLCGRGIKNVHVWLFCPPTGSNTTPKWSCLYDVTTNGVSIEALGFRERIVTPSDPSDDQSTHRLEMLSKSSGMGIRVWDLTHFDEESNISSNKIPYEDITTSNDCRAFSENGEMAFGGTYDLSTMRIETPKETVREIFEVPSPCLEDDNGQRRRRHMRQIQEILTTQDGQHALAICTDGGVLYYHHTYLNEIDSDGSFVELQSLMREVEIGPEYMTDGAWSLKRVGRKGAVVLVRACRNVPPKADENDEESCRGSLVDISLLSDLAPDSVFETSIPVKVDLDTLPIKSFSSPCNLPLNLVWTKWNCYFHDTAPTLDWDNQLSVSPRSNSPNNTSLFDDNISEISETPPFAPASSGAGILAVPSVPAPAPRGRPPSGKNKAPSKAQLQQVASSANSSSSSSSLPLAAEVSTPCSERSASTRSEQATPSSRSSSPLFSTPSSSSNSKRQPDFDSSLLTPTLSEYGTSLQQHITQISPLYFVDTSPSSRSECNNNNKSNKERRLNISDRLVPLSLPGISMQEEVEGEVTSVTPPQVRREISSSASSVRSSTSEVVKKVETKKKRPIQMISSSSSSSTLSSLSSSPSATDLNAQPLKKREIPPIGPAPKILRTVPSNLVLSAPPTHPLLTQFLCHKDQLNQSLSESISTLLSKPSPLQHQGLVLEQHRIHSLFYADMFREIQSLLESSLDHNSSPSFPTLHLTCQQILQNGTQRYRSLVNEVLRRQRMEVRIHSSLQKIIREEINNTEGGVDQEADPSQWGFLFSHMFTALSDSVEKLFCSFQSEEKQEGQYSFPLMGQSSSSVATVVMV